ncbi:glycosyl transferase family 1 [Gemmatimonadetes bacterium T265]|nr:glycosyl transferase family 1 [Gemmatimonadetes bacterium T265]
MSRRRPLRLVSIAHSYGVALNRRLAHEMGRAGAGRWEVTAVAPSFIHGDLRPVPLEPADGECCHVEPVPAYLTRNLHLLSYGTRLRQVLRQGWDLVHCWEEPFNVSAAQVAWWTPAGTPLVFYTFQNIDKRYPPPFSAFERYCVRRASGWLAAGTSVARTLVPRGYDRRPYQVVPLGVDTDYFGPNASAGRSVREMLGWTADGAPVVGYLGRFVPEKGIDLLTGALDKLHAGWRALFVGSGPMREHLERWAARHGDRVRIVTGVRHAEVPAYLCAMDLLTAPSQTTPAWREQLGRMLIEAFASGVPVLASDSGEIPFVVADAGRVVGERDEAGWVSALEDLLASPRARAEMARQGLERAHSVYAWPVIARQHLEFFEQRLAA